jgi:hypothetical protein
MNDFLEMDPLHTQSWVRALNRLLMLDTTKGSYFALTGSGRMTAASTPPFYEARINSAFETTNTWITHDIYDI